MPQSQFLDKLFEYLHFPLFVFGKTEFSAWYMLKLLIAIFILAWLSKRLKNFLVNKVLIRYNEDIGVRQSMGTIARYIFFVLGLFVLIHASGIDLSGLALVGGALGVGIGFGLQNITNNFVSGIVILLERPVKLGDRIEVGGTSGDVVSISARATTVVTNDGISVIIPNSELISTRVTNWSLTGKMVRFKIPIPVPYGTDQDLIVKLLLEVAKEDPNVAKEPATSIRLKEFAPSSIIFELVIWTSKLMQRQGMMRSRMNMAIYRKFNENGIAMPFPQMEVSMKDSGPEPKNKVN
ncbi:MAG: mechanosensitive ion channel [Bacteroidetes bacterium]|nr:mechanosensitive ion channel [Bacteroidota bacterium]